MKRQLLIIILITISFSTCGQRIDSLKTLINTKDFKQVDDYLTKAVRKKGIRYYSGVSRQIVASFDERVLIYEETIPVYNKGYFAKIETYRIELLTNGDKIIYCRMFCMKMRSFADKKAKTELKYIDKELLSGLQKEYCVLYKRQIRTSDFFNLFGRYSFNETN